MSASKREPERERNKNERELQGRQDQQCTCRDKGEGGEETRLATKHEGEGQQAADQLLERTTQRIGDEGSDALEDDEGRKSGERASGAVPRNSEPLLKGRLSH